MKKRFSGTDLQMVIMYAVSVVLAVIICVKMPDMAAFAVVAVCVVSGAVAMNTPLCEKNHKGSILRHRQRQGKTAVEF